MALALKKKYKLEFHPNLDNSHIGFFDETFKTKEEAYAARDIIANYTL